MFRVGPPALRTVAGDVVLSTPVLKIVAGVAALSVTSSLDNLVVGASLGANPEIETLSWTLNLVVSTCNAGGALASASLGRVLGSRAPTAAGLAAAAVFAFLAYGEVEAYRSGGESALARDAARGRAWVVAIPMTLNNMSGGVAGGLSGYPAPLMGLGALAASFWLMAVGFWVGRKGGLATGSNPHLMAATAFAALALAQVCETARDRRLARRGSPPPGDGAGRYAAVPSEVEIG